MDASVTNSNRRARFHGALVQRNLEGCLKARADVAQRISDNGRIGGQAGAMFWLQRKKLPGSYFFLISLRRS